MGKRHAQRAKYLHKGQGRVRHQENCHVCGKEIIAADLVEVLGKQFHRLCFVCEKCRDPLVAGEFGEYEDDMYCMEHLEEIYSRDPIADAKELKELTPKKKGGCCVVM
eukprot:TRINITY_DN214_c0_g6_i1.p1 TRINITY_DN214_c0_g6~~TRINITY_DN214_c0_g6_i1.p1  ORF type:complete len:108 (+),score=22.47 TRINITY_DN214_c0_g6_i1:148-471(+)